MLQDLVKYLVDLGRTSAEHKLIEHPTDPDKRFVIGKDGVKEIETPRLDPKGKDECYSVEDFAACLKTRQDFLLPQVWYDEASANAFSIDQFRRTKVFIQFPPHPILKTATSIATGVAFEQKQLIRFLKVALAGSVEEQVISRFRQLNWQSAKQVRQNLQHGRASLDQDVQASVTPAEGDMPEMFHIQVPLFADVQFRDLTIHLIVSVDIDVEQCRITLTLLPGSIEAIVNAQRKAIRNFLESNVDMDAFSLVCGVSQIEVSGR